MMQIPDEGAKQYRLRVPVIDFWESALNLNTLDAACGVFICHQNQNI
jgi:hypothetical protein